MLPQTYQRLRHLMVSILVLWFPFIWSSVRMNPYGQLPADRSLKPTLCGKLAFIEDTKTGARLIGLIPCGENRPYIFHRRPGDLHNYYRFREVLIVKDKNMSVVTVQYGVLYTYIYNFKDYVPINSCNECNVTAPTAKADQSKSVIICSTWILDEITEQFSEVIKTQEIEKIKADLEELVQSSQVQESCGANGTCYEQEVAIRLGNELGELFSQRSMALQRVVFLLKKLLINPASPPSCDSIARMIWYMAVGLNQQGYTIDLMEVNSPATQLATDAQGRRTGILENGSLVEEIPDSSVIVTSWNNYLLFPSSFPVIIQVRGTGFGTVTVRAIHNNGKAIQNAAFEGLLFTQSTHSNLDFYGSQPVIKIDTLNNGNVEAYNPDSYTEYSVLVAWLSAPPSTETVTPSAPSATPTLVATKTRVTATLPRPEETPTPTAEPVERPAFPSICPATLILAMLPAAAFCQRKKRQ